MRKAHKPKTTVKTYNPKATAKNRSAASLSTVECSLSSQWKKHIAVLILFILFFSAFFAPATFSGRLLAPGDGLTYYLPHFVSPHHLWDPLLMTGFPEAADPQVMSWYPLARVLSLIPQSWNWFVISAYVLAAWFMYLFVWCLTNDLLSAVVGGLIYGLSGFMMAHLGHTSMIHAAAWIPGMLLSAEQLMYRIRVRWVLIGGAMASQCILAGHPQIALYGLSLTGVYIIGGALFARQKRLAQIGAGASMFVFSLILSSIQIFPTATLEAMTPRVRLTFAEFSTFSLSLYHLILFLFPCLFGGAGATYFEGIPYFASWNLTEVAGYVGLSALVLSCIAVVSFRRNWKILFWLLTGFLALVASMGGATPLGRVVYSLPAFGQFRAQGRFVLIFDLAMAVLAAYGVLGIRTRSKRSTDIIIMLAGLFFVLFAGVFIIPALGPHIQAMAAANGIPGFPISLLGNRWIIVSVVSAVIVTAALILFRWRPYSGPIEALLIATIVCDLGAFGWFCEWRYASPFVADLHPSSDVRSDINELNRKGGRWLAVRGWQSSPQEAQPDLSALFGLPSIGKYGPLLPTRYGDLLQISSNASLFGNWSDPRNRALDLVGTRLVALPANSLAQEVSFGGLLFPKDELSIGAGNGCGATGTREHFSLSHAVRASSIGIVSYMGCSVGIEQGTPVLSVRLNGSAGRYQQVALKAGIDTAEWAANCHDVAPIIRHQQAAVFSRFSVARGAGVCQGQEYGTVLKLPDGPMEVRSLDFRWLPKSSAVIRVVSLAFSDGANETGEIYQAHPDLNEPDRWRIFHRDESVAIYENLRALPRTWLVSSTLQLSADNIKRAIQTSMLPGGQPYDPRAVALVEQPLNFRAPQDANSYARLINDANTAVDIETSSRQPAFLVLGDFDYPGWRVSINGLSANIVKTNYIQRGVLLPAGHNHVRFEFWPLSFYVGMAVSIAGLVLAISVGLFAHKRNVL